MKKIDKKIALELLSKVNDTIQGIVYENELKIKMKQELDVVIDYINDLEIDLFALLRNNEEIIDYNIFQVEDLVEIFGFGLDDEDQIILHELIKENLNLIKLGDWESIYTQVTEYLDKEFVFQYCPEIIEFINENSID